MSPSKPFASLTNLHTNHTEPNKLACQKVHFQLGILQNPTKAQDMWFVYTNGHMHRSTDCFSLFFYFFFLSFINLG